MNRDLHGNTHIKKIFYFYFHDAVFRYFRYLLYVRTP